MTKWVKEKNWWLFSDIQFIKQIINTWITWIQKKFQKNLIKFNIHENFVWIFNIKKYCNKTDFINKYCVSIKYLTLKHIISFYFYVTNWFLKTVWEIIKYYILNLILKLDNECFIQIQLSNLIIKNAFKFNYMFNFYHMWCIRIEVISSINFLSCTISCILWKHHNLAFNRIIFFFLKLLQSLFIFSQIFSLSADLRAKCLWILYFFNNLQLFSETK